jgi:bloom syndrome protein
VPFIALTATANANVKADVKHQLQFTTGCEEYSHSFNRPNLSYEVRPFAKDMIGVMAKIINEQYRGKCGIIYCLSRNDCENVAKELVQKHRILAQHYHAGMHKDEKMLVQRRWQAGEVKVVVATIAFGMGIDKPNVRYVFHYSLPKSLEGYYQETGRAGRDGKLSECIMFYTYRDKAKLERLIDMGEGDRRIKQAQKALLQNVVSYCENKSDCRRKQVLAYFGENFDAVDCKQRCDNCKSGSKFDTLDVTQLAATAVKIVQKLDDGQVTMLYCIDVFRGSKGSKIMQNGHDEIDGFAAGKDLHRDDVVRLFHLLVSKDAITEYSVVNGMGFPSTYLKVVPYWVGLIVSVGARPTTLCDKGIRLNYLFQWVERNKQVKRAAIVENRSL